MAKKRPRLTSIGGFGGGWDWATTDGEVARRLVVFLETVGRSPRTTTAKTWATSSSRCYGSVSS